MGEPMALLSLWEFDNEDVESGTSQWTIVNDRTELVMVSDIVCALVHKREGSRALVLVPTQLRGLLA